MSSKKAPIAIWPEGTPKPLMPYSPAVKAAGWLFVSGHLASDYEHGLAPTAQATNGNLACELTLQSQYIMETLAKTVAAAGLDIDHDAVRIWQWFTSDHPTNSELAAGHYWPYLSITPYLEIRNKFIGNPRPASTALAMKELLVKGTKLEVDLICIEGDGDSTGTDAPLGVPTPLAGYSPAIRRGDWIFLSGEMPVDWVGDYMSDKFPGEPSSLAKEARLNPFVWYGSKIEQQVEYTLQKLAKIAEAAGTSLDRAVKADVYLGNPADFSGMDKIWRRWFPKNPPARCVIPRLGFGGVGSMVEVAFTLLAGDSKLEIQRIDTPDAPRPFSHEPQAIKVGNLLFLSQQMACDETGVVPNHLRRDQRYPYYGQPGRLQMREILKNVSAICKAGGTSLENIVRRVCFHDEGAWFAESMDEWAAHFPGVKPASTTMVMGGPLVALGAHTLLDLIAYVPD